MEEFAAAYKAWARRFIWRARHNPTGLDWKEVAAFRLADRAWVLLKRRVKRYYVGPF